MLSESGREFPLTCFGGWGWKDTPHKTLMPLNGYYLPGVSAVMGTVSVGPDLLVCGA